MPDETSADEPSPDARPDVALGTIAKEWGRIGCTGFGGPPTHIAMLRRLTVEREHWLDETEFEDAIAATNLLPGPASTQLAIFCAWRLRGWPGALVGGACFICPGLAVIIALAAVFLASQPAHLDQGRRARRRRGGGTGRGQCRSRLDPRQLASGRAEPRPGGCAGSSTACSAASRRRRSAPSSFSCCWGAGWWRCRLGRCPPVRAPDGVRRGAAGRRGDRRAGRVGVGGTQGRRAVVRRWLRDHSAHAGRRRAPLPLDDERPVPQRSGPRADHARPGGADRRCRRLRRGGRRRCVCWRRSSRSRRRSSSSSSGPGTSVHCAPTGWRSPSCGGAGPAAIGAIAGASIPLALAIAHVWQVVILAGALALIVGLRRSVVLTLVGAGVIGAVGAALGLPSAAEPPVDESGDSVTRAAGSPDLNRERVRRAARRASRGTGAPSRARSGPAGWRRPVGRT